VKGEPFVAWPGAALRQTLPIAMGFAALFALSYGATSWVTARYESLPTWDLPFESQIPFLPSFAVVYLTITPALLLSLFVLRKRSEMAAFAAALSIETVTASLLFLLFPQTTAFVRPVVTGWARRPFALADTLNLEYNQFPSLHVAFACSAAWVYASRSGRAGRVFWAAWCAGVAASTWLMWEHHLVDIVGGIALAVFVMGVVYPRLQSAKFRQTTWLELCCLEQCARFSRRHFRYFVIFLAIYVPSLRDWRRYRVVRFGFCTAQWIDDLIDGDRVWDREPLEVIDELLVEIEQRTFSSRPLSRLTSACVSELERMRDDGVALFVDLVRTMQRDRRRVLDHEVWSAAQLDAHHRTTFARSVDLLLLTTRCSARAERVPSLVDALAWCSVFRDLDDDLRKGLVNVPLDVWSSGPAARVEWTRRSLARAREVVERASDEIARLADPNARRLLGIFQSSIAKFARRSARRLESMEVAGVSAPSSAP
jgi:hypothetical protein